MDNNSFSENPEGSVFRLKNREMFDNLASPKIFEKNKIIYTQGDDAKFVYYLKAGRVQIYVGSPGGAEKILAAFSGGSLFGKSAFFDKLPRATCARALEKSEIIQIDKQMMTEIIARRPQFALDMLEYLAKTIRVFSTQIENISFLKADKRLALYILENAENNYIHCTHDEISATIGASRVTVSKILRRFARAGWIFTMYGSVKVLDAEKLREFAEAD